ncbi:uncharacterized protein [Drosophila tropicalis]|uniref:uncharacterized protein n=1 Tax=Drosophila tropicalis TaxID=46794 RepID=UPI0035ABFD47
MSQSGIAASAAHRWMLPLLGLCLISLGLRCDARAVNVSNTWTMPQEGLNVFYRFFRDRISWFEADAVCQFHHANLVTVDNSFQFDATRDLLRELDVNDIVWIGLMRPQNSDRFMWSNSRPLVTDTGYWAESLPLMDAPLCAVIDPIRDYRWHALRCGGPETASFLCEMPVPSWADACILKDMPNLTMQYMADTASIELIRNCQEEGLLRHTCKGKEDRERAIRQLICPKERMEAQRITDMTNSHFKSLQIIQNIRTDNNENNDIDLLPLQPNYNRGGNLEIAVAPPPTSLGGVTFGIPHEVPRPVKKSGPRQPPPEHIDIMSIMMGDQPALSMEQLPDSGADVSNEIFEHLPHKKKILQQDLKTMPSIHEATTISFSATPKSTPKATTTTTTTTGPSLLVSTTGASQHTTHVIESADNSHFIPPMLMVKSHYIPPAKHGEHGEHIEHLLATSSTTTTTTTTAAPVETTTTTTATRTANDKTTTEKSATDAAEATKTTTMAAAKTSTAKPATTTTIATTTTTSGAAAATTTTAAAPPKTTTFEIIEKPTSTLATDRTVTTVKADVQATTPAATLETAAATTTTTTKTITTTAAASIATTTVTKGAANDLKLNSTTTTTTTTPAASVTGATATSSPSSVTAEAAATLSVTSSTTSSPVIAATTQAIVTIKAKETATTLVTETEQEVASTTAIPKATAIPTTTTTTAAPATTTTRRNFLQEETEAPFKPNRRRSLTKPETVSYFKKILG